jgi:hypothetical protein
MGELNYNLIIDTISKLDDISEIDIIDQIKYMIEFADDKLVFGDDIFEMINMKMLKVLYIHYNIHIEKLNLTKDYSFEIVKIKSDMITDYGGMIGIKFY